MEVEFFVTLFNFYLIVLRKTEYSLTLALSCDQIKLHLK